MIALLSIAVLSGLTIANFLYQAIGNQLWPVAFERSFFQGVAIIVFAGAIKRKAKP